MTGRLPHSYVPATARNVTPVDLTTGRVGVGFDLATGQVVRVSLTVADARWYIAALQDYLTASESACQSLRLSDRPSVLVSQEGQ